MKEKAMIKKKTLKKFIYLYVLFIIGLVGVFGHTAYGKENGNVDSVNTTTTSQQIRYNFLDCILPFYLLSEPDAESVVKHFKLFSFSLNPSNCFFAKLFFYFISNPFSI